jgi:hypothetical protein
MRFREFRPSRPRRKVRLAVLAPAAVILVAGSTVGALLGLRPHALLAVNFSGRDRLVTNEFSFWNRHATRAISSPVWEMTSGSLFVRHGVGWTGAPDARPPGPLSRTATNSAVFRLNTKRYDLKNVTVDFRLRNLGLVSTPKTPRRDWDGVHVWLHYQSEFKLYYVSVNRRDNTLAVKKKLPGGTDNGGTYYTLAEGRYRVSYQSWHKISARVHDNRDGSVAITLWIDGKRLLSAVDHGMGGPPITRAGAVGIRGDNCNFEFDRFQVRNS